MGLTLEFTSDLEPLLQAEARKQGSDPLQVAESALRRQLMEQQGHPTDAVPRLEAEESRLLEAINEGPSTGEMEHYLQLIRERQNETNTSDELDELLVDGMGLSDGGRFRQRDNHAKQEIRLKCH